MKMKTVLALTSLFLFGQPAWSDGTNLLGWTPLEEAAATGKFYNSNGYASANLNGLATFIAEQISHNRDLKNLKESRIAITSFVNLDNFQNAEKIGNTLSELLIHKLQISGYKVVDFKAMSDIIVTQTGDYVFSRNPSDLKNEYNIHYFLSGTLTETADGLVVNARLLDAKNSLVLSSAQAFIPARDVKKLRSTISNSEQPRVFIDKLPTPQPNMVKLRCNFSGPCN